jgi:thioredoxin reductase
VLETQELFDVTIVGGGPVGLFGTFYAGIRQMKTKLIDSLPELGGQLSALYPEKFVFDMPGFPKVLARDLAAEMSTQGTRFNPTVCLGEKVLTVRHEDDGTITLTSDKGEHRTKTVILAIGAGAFAPKKLGTPGVEEFEGRGVHYFVQNKAQFAGKDLLIVGGGDSALDWCMNLEPIAGRITLIHRSAKFRAHEESVDWLLNRSAITVRTFNELHSIGGAEQLEHATVIHNETKETEQLKVDAVLLNLGFSADIGTVKEWNLNMDKGSIRVNEVMQTNLSSVYAAGDIAIFPGKLKLIATGVGEICVAVNHAKTIVDPTVKFFGGHSTSMGLG